jgi:Uma2 family endonuclease
MERRLGTNPRHSFSSLASTSTIIHQELNSNITCELMKHLKAIGKCKVLSKVDWKINDETVVRPDSLVVCDLSTNKAYLSKTPEIIFEVLSPSTKIKDRNYKSNLYAENEVKYYVLVEPAGMFAEVYELKNGQYKLEGEYKDESYHFVLENGCGFEFSFSEVFDI